MKCVSRIRIDDDARRMRLGVLGCLQRCLQGVDRILRDTRVLGTVHAQYGCLEFVHLFDREHRLQRCRIASRLAVPHHCGADVGAVFGKQPGLAPAPAEPGDANARRIAAVLFDPSNRCIQITTDLRVGHLGDDLLLQLADRRNRLRIALAYEQLGGNGQIAELGKPPADVGDVLMHAEDLADDDHHRELGLALGLGTGSRTIRRHLEIADGHGHLARRQTVEVRLDGLRRHGQHRRRKCRTQRRLHEAAAVKVAARHQTFHFCIQLHRTLLAPEGGDGERSG